MKELAQQAQVLLGLRLNSAQLRALEKYENELIAWNERFNLTAIDTPEKIRTKHFLDSFTCLLVMRDSSIENVIDVGSGAGFPGIPLKIACPAIKLTLIEATRKKVEFLKHIVEILNLQAVELIWGRAEEIAKEKRDFFDLAVSRAVAEMRVLCEYGLPLVSVGGMFVAYKEEKVEDEVKAAENAIQRLGGKLEAIHKLKLPNTEIVRSLVLIDKISPTPPAFPRRPGLAKKRPL